MLLIYLEVLLGLQRGDSARAVGSLLLVPVSRDILLEAVTKVRGLVWIMVVDGGSVNGSSVISLPLLQYPSETERLRELIERSRTAS